MFSNIGKKIRGLAKVLCWLGIVCSVLLGVAIILCSVFAGKTTDTLANEMDDAAIQQAAETMISSFEDAMNNLNEKGENAGIEDFQALTNAISARSGSTIQSAVSSVGRVVSAFGIIIGILVIVFGSLISWISCFTLYGFGELVVTTKEIADNTKAEGKLKEWDNEMVE